MKKLSILTIFSFVQLSAWGQYKTQQEFVKWANATYENLTFNDVSLKDVQISLENYPLGLAFAALHPQSKQKVIWINYAYLYQKMERLDSIQKKAAITCILTHEWAHHFMNHSLNKPSDLNERNADILAGRIMAENKIEVGDAMEKLFEILPQSLHHLSDEARRDLWDLGARTYKISSNNINELCSEVVENAKTLYQREVKYLDRKIPELDRKTQEQKKVVYDKNKDSLSRHFKKLLKTVLDSTHQSSFFSLSNTERTTRVSDTLSFFDIYPVPDSDSLSYITTKANTLPDSARNIDAFESFAVNPVDVDSLIASSGFQLKLNVLRTEQNKTLKKEMKALNNEEQFKTLARFRQRKELLRKLGYSIYVSDTSVLFEALYNRWFFERRKQASNLCIGVNEKLERFIQSQEFTSAIYSLEGGIEIQVDFVGSQAVIIAKNKATTKTVVQTTTEADKNQGFLHFFEVKEGNKTLNKFLIDTSYHLWTETIAAKSINNKLFLQRYQKKSGK